MKIHNLNENGKVTKVSNSKNNIFEIGDLVKSNATGNIIVIEGFIGDNDEKSIYATGKDGLKKQHNLNIEYLKNYTFNIETCGCTGCTNFCTRTGKKILK